MYSKYATNEPLIQVKASFLIVLALCLSVAQCLLTGPVYWSLTLDRSQIANIHFQRMQLTFLHRFHELYPIKYYSL